MAEKHFQQKLSFIEKAGYSLGDGAANFVFMSMILFQLNFYTHTLSLSAGIAGTLLLIGRLWDAFFDPMMGTIADRTKTRWGKFRPWVLWTALPWGIFMVLAYTHPGFSKDSFGLIAWAVITNIMLMTLYSANNTPYSAMTAAMTGDVNERTSLSSYRFVAAMLAQLIVGGFTLPLVSKFGGNPNSAHGWVMVMGIWAIICIVCFLIAFLTTRERIQPPPQQKLNPKEDFSNLLKNGPWIAMFTLTLVHFIYVAMRGGVVIYYFQYYIDNNSLFNFLHSIGMPAEGDTEGLWYFILNGLGFIIKSDHSNVSSVGFSLLNMSSQFITVIGVLFSTYLSIKFGKKLIAILGFSFTSVFMVLFMLLPADAIWATFILDWLRALTYAPTIPLIWAMFADVVDFSEWKFNRRPAGIIYATILFGLKTGLSLGVFLAGWILAFYGFVEPEPNAVTLPSQSPEAVFGIRMLISIFPTICLAIVVGCLIFYKISKQMNLQIQDELAERRKNFATETI
jgi:GPH family glycoside/pentoside/hexuronide:cation symporter